MFWPAVVRLDVWLDVRLDGFVYVIFALFFLRLRALTHPRQVEKKALPQWIAVACVLIALLFAGLEVTHVHGAARSGNASGPCAICISAHANLPPAASQSLPVILTVAILALPFNVDVKGVPADLTLFIRPPPAA